MDAFLQAQLLQGKMKLAPVKRPAGSKTLPEIACPSLDDLELEVHVPPAATEKEIEDLSRSLLESQTPVVDLEAGDMVRKGDLLIVDMLGFDRAGVVPTTAKRQESVTEDIDDALPGFYRQLVGRRVGESIVVEVRFTSDYFVEHLRGHAIVYSVDIRGGQRRAPVPAKTKEEHAAETAALRAALPEILAKRAERQFIVEARELVLEVLVKNAKVVVPSALVTEEVGRFWSHKEGDLLVEKNIPMEQQTRCRDFWGKMEGVRLLIERSVARTMVLHAVAREHLANMKLSMEDLDARVADADPSERPALIGWLVLEKSAELVFKKARVFAIDSSGRRSRVLLAAS